jgi:hypothetical protein
MEIKFKKKQGYFILGLVLVFGLGFVVAQAVPSKNPGHTIDQIRGLPSGVVCTTSNSATEQGCGIGVFPSSALGEGGASSGGSPDQLVKFGGSGSSFVGSSIKEGSGGGIGIGSTGVLNGMVIFGDEVRVGEGSPNRADGSGDLYVENTLEVDGRICITGEGCIDSFSDTLKMVESGVCVSNIPGPFQNEDDTFNACEIGNSQDYRYCAISSYEIDRGGCAAGKLVLNNHPLNGKWVVVSYTYPWSAVNTRCWASCLKRNLEGLS